MTTQINLNTLAAVALAASDDKTRYYLAGVLVECRPRHVTYVATDGSRLLAHRHTLAEHEPDNTTLGDFIIPRAQCTVFKPSKRADPLATLTGDREELTLAWDGKRSFAPVDGTFPSWRRVIPQGEPSGEAAHFPPKQVLDFAKFGEAMGYGSQPWIAHNGLEPTRVTWTGNVDTIGIIMPIQRPDAPVATVPAWFLEAQP